MEIANGGGLLARSLTDRLVAPHFIRSVMSVISLHCGTLSELHSSLSLMVGK